MNPARFILYLCTFSIFFLLSLVALFYFPTGGLIYPRLDTQAEKSQSKDLSDGENVIIDKVIADKNNSVTFGHLINPDVKNKPEVLGTTDSKETESVTPTLASQKAQTKDLDINPRKATKTIAIIGDSMVDTMGTELPYLKVALKKKLPNVDFKLLNYGIGARPINKLVEDLEKEYNYKDRQYKPITQAKADLYIIESSAYNPLGKEEEKKNEYKTQLGIAIDTLKKQGKPVILLVPQSPIKKGFGKGPGGVNWGEEQAKAQAVLIQDYLSLASSLGVSKAIPVLDLYAVTTQDNGDGIAELVDSHDGIHPSKLGQEYTAYSLAKFIFYTDLLGLN